MSIAVVAVVAVVIVIIIILTITIPTNLCTLAGACENLWDDGQCAGWARDGECDLNPMWMKENCKRSCNSCDDDDKPGESLTRGKPWRASERRAVPCLLAGC